ncbi:hypothetical protein BJF79_36620 [Actinomadura sp. CNU-125]|nr:hypothetical protein BJF79_36620 [Actinomadura sp. CNU-125]
MVIARTDALAAAGPDEALRRVEAFAAARRDAIMVERAVDGATLRRVRDAAGGLPLVVNCSAAGSPADPLDELGRAGARLVLYPVTAALAGAAAMRDATAPCCATSRAPAPAMSWTELNDLLGLPELADRFPDPDPGPAPSAATEPALSRENP